jgi:hypothetical protein
VIYATLVIEICICFLKSQCAVLDLKILMAPFQGFIFQMSRFDTYCSPVPGSSHPANTEKWSLAHHKIEINKRDE